YFSSRRRAIREFRKSWARATRQAGVAGTRYHDMRRSCARNLTQAGVPREVAKQVTGHVSDSMWERYNIVIVADKISDFTRKHTSSRLPAARSRSRPDGSQRDAKIGPLPACHRLIRTVSG